MEKIRARVFVSGRVQGVFYRAETIREAKRIGGLTGWARNLPDGRVEVICEGDKGNVEKLISWLWQGPEYAQVTDVEVIWEKATGEFSNFDIRA